MSVFSECLEIIRERRTLSNAQIAKLCGVEKTVVHRWFAGQRLPESWERVEEIAEDLQLSLDEKCQLREAYERTVVGEEQYESYQEIIEIMKELGKDHEGHYRKNYKFITEYKLGELPEFILLENEAEILQCMENLFAYLSLQEKKHLCLKMQNEPGEAALMIKMFCQWNPDCEVEKVIYMNNDLVGSKVYNMKLFHDALTLLLMKCKAEVYYAEATNSDRKFTTNGILSDYFFIQFNDQMSYGMMTTKKEWLDFFREDFMQNKAASLPLGQKNISTAECCAAIQDSHNNAFVKFGFMPDVTACLTEKILCKMIGKEVPEREKLIHGILHMFVKEEKKYQPEHQNVFFFYDGLIQFMESGMLELFPYRTYQPVDMETRCELLRKAITFSKKGLVVQYMFKRNTFSGMDGIHMEQVHGEKEKLIFERKNKAGLKERLLVTEKKVLHPFWQFFNYLKNSEYVYNREETIARMEQVLTKYVGI